jgi:glycosyl transferase family 87
MQVPKFRHMTPKGSASPGTALMLAAVLVVLATGLAMANIQWPFEDFAEYWAAGRLNAVGTNPYDPAAMLREQARIGWTESSPVMMYNPPWTLALAMPMGAVDFRLGRSIWLPLQLFLTLWCVSRLWILYGGAAERTPRAWYLALLWSPTLIALRFGQLSPVILLGLVGFLWSVERRRDFTAGAFLALTAVKPQLVALVWVPFILWVLADRKWKVLAGTAACGIASIVTAVSTNPRVFAQYFDLMASAPPTLSFESPNIATVLRVLLRTEGSWPQYVPTFLGAVLVTAMWYRRREGWEWRRQMPGLVLISCLLTSYGGWAFDLVVLLVPIVALAATVVRLPRRSLALIAGAVFLLVSSLALAMHTARVPQAAFVWMTPAVAMTWWALKRRLHSLNALVEVQNHAGQMDRRQHTSGVLAG